MASRIVPIAQDEQRQRQPRKKSQGHLGYIRTLPCLITGNLGVEAAHVRYASQFYGKRECGKSEKPDDCWTVPLCPEWHRKQHAMNEQKFWLERGIDPCAVALRLYSMSGDVSAGIDFIRKVRNGTAAFSGSNHNG